MPRITIPASEIRPGDVVDVLGRRLTVGPVASCRCGHAYADHTHGGPGGSCTVCARVEGGLRCHHWRGGYVSAEVVDLVLDGVRIILRSNAEVVVERNDETGAE